MLRALADECLIACAFFEQRLRRNGTIRHYVGLGQMSYDAAALTEQAYGFVHMRDVIASAAGRDTDDSRVLIDHARSGSQTARAELAQQNVVIGPWGESAKAWPALALSLSAWDRADRCRPHPSPTSPTGRGSGRACRTRS